MNYKKITLLFLFSLLLSGCWNNYESEFKSCQENNTKLLNDYTTCDNKYDNYREISEKHIEELESQIINLKNDEVYLAENVNSTILKKIFFEKEVSGNLIVINNISFIVINFLVTFFIGLKFEFVTRFVANIKISKENNFAGLIIVLILVLIIFEYGLMLINFLSPFINI